MKHPLETNPQGFAILKEELFLIFPDFPGIEVYNIDSFAFQRTITVEGMEDAWDIAVSEDALYVSALKTN